VARKCSSAFVFSVCVTILVEKLGLEDEIGQHGARNPKSLYGAIGGRDFESDTKAYRCTQWLPSRRGGVRKAIKRKSFFGVPKMLKTEAGVAFQTTLPKKKTSSFGILHFSS